MLHRTLKATLRRRQKPAGQGQRQRSQRLARVLPRARLQPVLSQIHEGQRQGLVRLVRRTRAVLGQGQV